MAEEEENDNNRTVNARVTDWVQEYSYYSNWVTVNAWSLYC